MHHSFCRPPGNAKDSASSYISVCSITATSTNPKPLALPPSSLPLRASPSTHICARLPSTCTTSLAQSPKPSAYIFWHSHNGTRLPTDRTGRTVRPDRGPRKWCSSTFVTAALTAALRCIELLTARGKCPADVIRAKLRDILDGRLRR
jgi:hypothetical protein